MDESDYEARTRRHYQDAGRAHRYHARFTERRWRYARRHFVAARERRMLQRMLAPHRPGVILDVPCGTGKMAGVFADLGATPIAADISEEMMAVAKEEYRRIGHHDAEFLTTDAESVSQALRGRSVDVACCIRLLHRVPEGARRRILGELSRTAPLVLASYSVTSPLQRLRSRVLRKKGALADRLTIAQIEAELCERFVILDARPIARGVCSEWFYLVSVPEQPAPRA